MNALPVVGGLVVVAGGAVHWGQFLFVGQGGDGGVAVGAGDSRVGRVDEGLWVHVEMVFLTDGGSAVAFEACLIGDFRRDRLARAAERREGQTPKQSGCFSVASHVFFSHREMHAVSILATASQSLLPLPC